VIAPNPYLPAGLPIPVAELDGLANPYWNALREERLLIQRCTCCGTWQFAPEWICNHCHEFDPGWTQVDAVGRIYSWERVWHPAHPALKFHGPYLAVLIELPHAGGTRMVGNLIGDPLQEVLIGLEVIGVFEHHTNTEIKYSLLQWRLK
jgi:uncharacterized OB-fold protein